MVRQITEHVIVKPGGVIEIRRPELREGVAAEVTIVQEAIEAPDALPMSAYFGKAKSSYASAKDVVDTIRAERDAWEPDRRNQRAGPRGVSCGPASE